VPAAFFEKIAAIAEKKFTFDQIAQDYTDTLANQFKVMQAGSAIAQFSFEGQVQPNSVTIWIGRNNVMLMIGKEEIKSFLLNAKPE